jgi:hypothetical protein
MDWIDLAQAKDQWKACEHGNEPSGSVKCREIVEWLHNWRLLKKGSTSLVSEYSSTWGGLALILVAIIVLTDRALVLLVSQFMVALYSNSTCWKWCCVDRNIINSIYSDLHNRIQQNMPFAFSSV